MSGVPELDTAWQMLQQERFDEAIALAERVLLRQPGNVAAIACRAMAIWRTGRDEQHVMSELRRAIELAPAESSLRHNYATVLTNFGDIDEAALHYREALRLKPDDTMAFWGLTLNARFDGDDEIVERMTRLYDAPAITGLRREFLAYGIAKVFDDRAIPDRAIAYAIEANRLGQKPWDRDGEFRALAELRELAAADIFRKARNSGHPTRAPLFIVGLPRSGTTLVETILSRHPDVLALGESFQIPHAVRDGRIRRRATGSNTGRIELVGEVGRDWLSARAETIAKDWAVRAGGPVRLVTDKMPDNALQLGMIAALFPRAKVIYARRQPLDIGVSNFFQRLGQAPGFTNRLDWLGERIRLVADTMELWRGALDLDILDVSYEALVADPEPAIRRIAAFTGLNWTDAMLTPEKSTRSVRTASHWQIRQPINTRSVARWTRYEPWLEPTIDGLGGRDWIALEMADQAAKGAFT
jgi:hypothetical protein